MLKQQNREGERPGRPGFGKDPMVDAQDARRLQLILINGLSAATSYSSMNRDRYHVYLKEGVSQDRLLEFCQRELGGNPIPDRVADSHIMLSVLKNAETAGLVTIELVKAGPFLPELKRIPV